MANVLTQNPIIIDASAGAQNDIVIAPQAGDPASAGKRRVIHIRWIVVVTTVGGDTAVITSLATAGNKLWESVGPATAALNYVEDSRIEQWWDTEGFKASVSKGLLYIYFQ